MSFRVKDLKKWLAELPLDADEDFLYIESHSKKLGEVSPITGFSREQKTPERVIFTDARYELL